MKRHKNEHRSRSEIFKCEQCKNEKRKTFLCSSKRKKNTILKLFLRLMIGNDCMNESFANASQVITKSIEKTNKCEKCDFKTTPECEIVEHKTESHNWCSFCFSSFKVVM